MIEFMMNHQDGTLIYQHSGTMLVQTRLLTTINQLCMDHLTTYEGYRKSVQYIFQRSYALPIYLCDEMQFIPSGRYRSYETIYVNVAAIQTYKPSSQGLLITFISGRTCDIKVSLYRFEKQLHLLHKIRDTKVKHFH